MRGTSRQEIDVLGMPIAISPCFSPHCLFVSVYTIWLTQKSETDIVIFSPLPPLVLLFDTGQALYTVLSRR